MPNDHSGIVGIDPSFTHFGVYDGKTAHVIKTDPVRDVSEEVSIIQRTTQIIKALDKITMAIVSDVQLWYIEAPMFRVPAHGGSHLYQLGFLMCSLHEYVRYLADSGLTTKILQADKPTVLKTLFGRARIHKAVLPEVVFDKYGVRFERDAGLDRLHAFLMWRYGIGCIDGEWTHYPAARRGKPKQRAIQLLDD